MFWMIVSILLLFIFTFLTSLVNVFAFATLAFPQKIKRETIYGIALFFALTFPVVLLFLWKPLISVENVVIYGAVTGVSVSVVNNQRLWKTQRLRTVGFFCTLVLSGSIGMLTGYAVCKLAAHLYLKGLGWLA